MRIFYASSPTPDAHFRSRIWHNNLYLPLKDLGHDVVEFRYDLRRTFRYLEASDPIQASFIKKNKVRLTNALLKQIKAAHKRKPVKLFFSYLCDSCIFPEAIDEIRSMGIVTVNWYCNGSYQLYQVAEISPHYDWCLVPEKFRIQDYLSMGANPIYCQEAANPNIYRPCDVLKEFDVSFVGQAYGNRPEYIQYLVDREIKVRVWGNGWQYLSSELRQANQHFLKRLLRLGQKLLRPEEWRELWLRFQLFKTVQNETAIGDIPSQDVPSIDLPAKIVGGILSDRAMIDLYSRSKINLGFSTCGNTHLAEKRILQIRLRDFEVPMSGGFYMVEYMEELEEFFTIGEEIVCYTDPEDLADKIRYYLAHDEERERIRLAGMRRARGEHTWHQRFQAVFQEIGLD